MRASLTRVLAALALALPLAGCGGGNPTPSPVVESPPATSATPSTAAPTMPAAAVGISDSAKEETVRWYLRTLSYAASTGDVAALDAVETKDCNSCAGVRANISKVYEQGGRISGDGYEASDVKVETKQVEGDPVLRVSITSHQQVTFASPSASPQVAAEEVVAARFRLSKRSDHWVVREWTRVS